MKSRYSERVSVQCLVVFAGDSMAGEGRVLDISLPGCLLESIETVKPGDYVRLRLFLPDKKTPLNVSLAAVRWADGCRFGVEFIRTSDEEQGRLDRFVRGHLPPMSNIKNWSEGIVIMGATGR